MQQLKNLLILALLFSASSAFAAIPNAAQWELRTTGNNGNGCGFDSTVSAPGTDYSQQDSAQVSFTDLVIGSTNTQLTSASNAFSSVSPGNFIQISGGTGFTTGMYEILSVSGSTATMDRAVGTASSTGGTGKLGGGCATPQGVLTLISGSVTGAFQFPQNTVVWTKSGTYTWTSTWSYNIGSSAVSALVHWIGYQTTHGDYSSTRPLWTTSTNSVDLVRFATTGSQWVWIDNIDMSNTAGTKGSAFVGNVAGGQVSISNVKMSGFNVAMYCNYAVTFTCQVEMWNTEISGSASYAMWVNQGGLVHLRNVWIHGGSSDGIRQTGSDPSGPLILDNVVISGNSGTGIVGTANMSLWYINNCVFYNNTGAGIDYSANNTTNGNHEQISNSIFYGNGTYGIKGSTSVTNYNAPYNNAFGNNTTAASLNWTGIGNITLTADPFTNPASGDFSLNSSAGGGALLKQAGFPGVTRWGSTGYISVGAIQPNTSGGGTTVLVAPSAY